MFRGLRLRLTFLYLLIAAAFTALMIAGTNHLVARYFENTTDLALRYRMAQEFSLLGIPLPTELDTAVEAWSERRDTAQATSTPRQPLVAGGEHETGDEEEGQEHLQIDRAEGSEGAEEAYDGDLAPIYTLPLDPSGSLQPASQSTASALVPDKAAVQSALLNGSDLRTVQLDNGISVRLLTYSVPADGENPAFLQLGRPLNDQQRVLGRLVVAMSGLGGAMLVILSFGSWRLAGRSISPAEEAWDKQQTFIANAGHELRTPLTLIRANTEVALRKLEAAGAVRSKLEDILRETDHMSKLVQDLLLLSRLDAGALRLERQSIEIKGLLTNLMREVEALAAGRGIEVTLQADAGSVLADETRLRQVLLILFDNALAHTPAGGRIAFRSHRIDQHILLEITDTGTGISREHLERVFERFFQAEPLGSSGSGLGLSIAKSLAEAMGGELELESREGEGTTARLTLARES
jgi:signal transduction histidine kinase